MHVKWEFVSLQLAAEVTQLKSQLGPEHQQRAANAWNTDAVAGTSIVDQVRSIAEQQQAMKARNQWVQCQDQRTFYNVALRKYYDPVCCGSPSSSLHLLLRHHNCMPMNRAIDIDTTRKRSNMYPSTHTKKQRRQRNHLAHKFRRPLRHKRQRSTYRR